MPRALPARFLPGAVLAAALATLVVMAPMVSAPALAAEGGHGETGGIGEIVDLFKHETKKGSAAGHATPAPDPAVRLADVRKELAAIESPGAATSGSPPGTPESEVADRIRLLHQLERSLSLLVDDRVRHAPLVAARKDAEERADAWHGFPDPPPYALPFVDGLESEHHDLSQQIATLKSRERLLQDIETRLDERLRSIGAGLRQAEEQSDDARGDTGVERARWLLGLARLRSEEATAALEQTRQARANVREASGTARAELRLTDAKLRVASGHIRFTQQDLDGVLRKLDAAAASLTEESDRAVSSAMFAFSTFWRARSA